MLRAATLTDATMQNELKIYDLARKAPQWNPKFDIPWQRAWGFKDEKQEEFGWKLASH